MRRETYCEGCGEAEFQLVETFASEDATGEAEVFVWDCLACGGRTEVVESLGFAEVAEAGRTRQVA